MQQARFYPGPSKTAVALVNKIRRLAFNQAPRLSCKDQVIVEVKGRARRAQRHGLYDGQRGFRFIQTGDGVVADEMNFRALCRGRVDKAVDVGGCTARRRARSRRRAQVSNTRLR